jgi:ribulose-5-phosphate 4-epimerase/fuculose-1-phosphate aldolase
LEDAVMSSQPAQVQWRPAELDPAEKARVLALANEPQAIEAKTKLAAGFRVLAQVGVVHGLYQGLYGHISLRVPTAPEYFWVNPLAVPFAEMTADDLVLISGKGELVEGQNMHNFAAFFIHASIHAARTDINCVCHTHAGSACAFAALGEQLQPIDQIGCAFFEDHALHSAYTGVVAERSQGEAMVESLGDKRALILVNHGLLTGASTVEQAVIDMYELERTCDVQLRALATGRPLKLIPPEYARQVRSIRTRPGRYKAEWHMLMRELDRLNPGYAGKKGRPAA